jgi:hypothetical protein
MSLYDLLVIFHLLLFVYWLGGDMGVFYSSGMVIDPKLSNSARATAAKIMINLDLVPRICMTLMLTVGGLLTGVGNYMEHPLWQTIGFILLGPGWLSMVLFIHFNEGKPIAKAVARIDYWFRWVLVIYLITSVTVSFAIGRLSAEPWIGAKLAIFAGMVFCGIMIRKFIPDYAIGVHKLRNDESSDEINTSMNKSLAMCRPFVYAIWIGLVIECYLGVVQPGGTVRTSEVLSSLMPFIGL